MKSGKKEEKKPICWRQCGIVLVSRDGQESRNLREEEQSLWPFAFHTCEEPPAQLYIADTAAINKAHFHALNRAAVWPGDTAAQVASGVNFTIWERL